jgi:signal peptidase I
MTGQPDKKGRRRHKAAMAVFLLIFFAAAAATLAVLHFPIFRVYGTSMEPVLESGDLVAAEKTGNLSRGDVIAFYYNNKILIRRVIAGGGESVSIEADGTVSVDGELQEEPYLQEKSGGSTDLSYPYTVPDGSYFVMGDNRAEAADSRSSVIGCVSEDQLIGKLFWCIWPLGDFGPVR